MRTVFATIRKNSSEDLQVAGEIYKGNAILDVRVPAGERFSNKGLAMAPKKWRELLPVIAAAIEEFERQLADPESELAKELAQ